MTSLNVTVVPYHLRSIKDFSDFAFQVEEYAVKASPHRPDLLLYPEFLTTQLMSFFPGEEPGKLIRRLDNYTGDYLELFRGLAARYGCHIVGGTHVTGEAGAFYNTAFLFYPDGRVEAQRKIHLTPTEKRDWLLTAGNQLQVFTVNGIKVGILICYDIEFPETARALAGAGADLILCPSCTDDVHGLWRVRHTAQSRAVENQIFVTVTGTTGELPSVNYMEENYGQGVILTPCDLGFPPGGVLAESPVNTDTLASGTLDFETLWRIRREGSVTLRQDMRPEVYRQPVVVK